jgi:SEC-C motif-containing protein
MSGTVWRSESADIEAVLVFPELRGAYADGLIEPKFMHPSELDEVEGAPRGLMLEKTRERYPPIDDIVEATTWSERLEDARVSTVPGQPYRASRKVGRNEPCPCGSGRKFKKCCGG